MDDHQSSMEEKIKEAVKKEYEKAPAPPVSKDETWAQIQLRLSEEPTKQPRPFRPKRWVGIAAAIVILLLGIGFFQVQNGSAFGWVTKFFIQSKGNITQLRGSIITPKSHTKNQAPVIWPRRAGVVKKKMSLSEAKTVTNFSIGAPTKVPDGFHFQNVTVWFIGDRKKSNKVVFHYSGKDNGKLVILEWYAANDLVFSGEMNKEDSVVKKVKINGEKGALILPKVGMNELIWTRMGTLMKLRSTLPEKEVLSVARSIQNAGT